MCNNYLKLTISEAELLMFFISTCQPRYTGGGQRVTCRSQFRFHHVGIRVSIQQACLASALALSHLVNFWSSLGFLLYSDMPIAFLFPDNDISQLLRTTEHCSDCGLIFSFVLVLLISKSPKLYLSKVM